MPQIGPQIGPLEGCIQGGISGVQEIGASLCTGGIREIPTSTRG